MNKLEIKNTLASLWKSILGNVDISESSSFYELGGDKFLFSALLTLIEKTFLISLSMQNQKSLEKFSNQVDFISKGLTSNAAHHPIITLNHGTKLPALILIHPLGGTIFNYMNLVNKLTKENPIYGIQDRIYYGEMTPFLTLENQAEFYTKCIRNKIMEKNIILIGHSSGGVIAHEIAANLLKEPGYKIQKTIMLDSWIEIPNEDEIRKSFKRIMLRQIEKLNPKSFLAKNLSVETWLKIMLHRMNTLFQYRPKKLELESTLFLPKDSVAEYKNDVELTKKWRKYLRKLDVFSTPGNHESMLDKGKLNLIADYVNKLLIKVNTSNEQ